MNDTSMIKNIAALRTCYYEDREGEVKAGDEYGRWYIVGIITTRHYYDSPEMDREIFSEQIKIKDLKNPKPIDKKDIWR